MIAPTGDVRFSGEMYRTAGGYGIRPYGVVRYAKGLPNSGADISAPYVLSFLSPSQLRCQPPLGKGAEGVRIIEGRADVNGGFCCLTAGD